MRPRSLRHLAAPLVLLFVAAAPAAASAPSPTTARALHARVERSRVFRLPGRPSHIALHWRGGHSARVRVALGRHGRLLPVRLDELAEGRRTRETYGALM